MIKIKDNKLESKNNNLVWFINQSHTVLKAIKSPYQQYSGSIKLDTDLPCEPDKTYLYRPNNNTANGFEINLFNPIKVED